MKLPNFYIFEPLNALKQRMGIPKDVYGTINFNIGPPTLTLDELTKLTTGEGIDVGLDEVQVLEDGTLAYKNSRVLLYIRDVHRYAEKISLPRYHLANCNTLKHMRETGRSERYLVSAKTDGTFSLNIFSPHRTARVDKLDVCQNCLVMLQFDGFRGDLKSAQRQKFVRSFTPMRFFEVYPRSLHTGTHQHESNAPINDYPPDWNQISKRVREGCRWRCEEANCNYDLSAAYMRQYLDVHHVNGDRSNNARHNLRALCVECHAKQPHHSQIKATPRYSNFLRLR